MRKLNVLFLSALSLGSLVFMLSSCGDDEPTKYQLSLSQTSVTALESDLKIEIDVVLDKPAPENMTVKYTLAGTAYDNVRADDEQKDPDYEVDGDYKEVDIKKGESAAKITLIPYSDELLEDPETIEITIEEVDVENIIFDAASKTTITLNQEDGMLISLDWPAASTAGVADMDIIVRIGETATTPDWDGVVTGSAYRGFEINYEFVFLPKTYIGTFFSGLTYTNTTYGLSYTYYDGSLDPLDFEVTFIEVINGAAEPVAQRQIFNQSYTADNKNKWASPTLPSIIAQTFVNNGGVYSNVSEVVKQTTSSRDDVLSANSFLANPRRSKFVQSITFHDMPQKFKTQLNLK